MRDGKRPSAALRIRDIDRREIERRKEVFRRVWRRRKVERLPISVWCDDFSRYSLREQCENGGLQLEVMAGCLNRCLTLFDDDYVPHARIWPGYATIATMFGMELHWSDDPSQPPGPRGCLIRDLGQLDSLKRPDPRRDGLMPANLRWLAEAARRLPPEVSLTGIDLGGPINTAKDLMDTNLLYTALIDAPEAVHRLLELALEVQLDCYREIVRAVGGSERLTSIDFDPIWAPEGCKGFVSDDVCAALSPGMYRTFSAPYNRRVFAEFGPGRLHNCGPHPSAHLYMASGAGCKGLNCSFRYTRPEFPKLREAFRGRGLVEVMFDNGESPEEILAGYEEVAGALAPEVAALPLLIINETHPDDQVRDLHQDLKTVAARYAREMRWDPD